MSLKQAGIKLFLRFFDRFCKTTLYAEYNKKILGFHNPEYTFPRSAIAIIHAPKTAGTSLKAILSKIDYPFINLDKHAPISTSCAPGEYRYVTFLRDPIERVFSYYQMQRRDPSQPYHHISKFGLEALLEKCWEVRNVYARYYSGCVSDEPDNETRRLAKANLENFFFVGCFETFEHSLAQLLEKIGCDANAFIIPKLNSSKNPKIADKEYDLVRKYNHLDIQIYSDFTYK